MKLESFVSRARFLLLVLPLFGLCSSLHVGCSSSNNSGYYGYGNYGYGSYGGGSSSGTTPDPSNPFGE